MSRLNYSVLCISQILKNIKQYLAYSGNYNHIIVASLFVFSITIIHTYLYEIYSTSK